MSGNGNSEKDSWEIYRTTWFTHNKNMKQNTLSVADVLVVNLVAGDKLSLKIAGIQNRLADKVGPCYPQPSLWQRHSTDDLPWAIEKEVCWLSFTAHTWCVCFLCSSCRWNSTRFVIKAIRGRCSSQPAWNRITRWPSKGENSNIVHSADANITIFERRLVRWGGGCAIVHACSAPINDSFVSLLCSKRNPKILGAKMLTIFTWYLTTFLAAYSIYACVVMCRFTAWKTFKVINIVSRGNRWEAHQFVDYWTRIVNDFFRSWFLRAEYAGRYNMVA